jgi:hypothetical protein
MAAGHHHRLRLEARVEPGPAELARRQCGVTGGQHVVHRYAEVAVGGTADRRIGERRERLRAQHRVHDGGDIGGGVVEERGLEHLDRQCQGVVGGGASELGEHRTVIWWQLIVERYAGFGNERAPEHHPRQPGDDARRGTRDHVAAPAMPDQGDVVQTRPVDLIDDRVHAVGQRDAGRVVVDAQAGAGRRQDAVPRRP